MLLLSRQLLPVESFMAIKIAKSALMAAMVVLCLTLFGAVILP
jgi:hypothetical protein